MELTDEEVRQAGYRLPRHAYVLESAQRRETFLHLIIAGRSVSEAIREMGINVSTYGKWRSKHPIWKQKVDAAKQQRKGMLSGSWDGTFSSWQAAFIPSPDGGEFQSGVFQQRIAEELENTGEGEITLVVLPPGARKTTTVENWCAYKLARDPNHRILCISKTRDHATKSVGRLKTLLADDHVAPALVARFGPFYENGQEKQGKPWQSQYFTVTKRNSADRDYSFSAAGLGGQIYGSRADTIILDDPQDLKSLHLSAKLLNQIRQEIITRRPAPGKGRVVIIMTRIGHDDLVEHLERSGICTRIIRLPVTGTDGKSNDPIVFPDEVLPLLRKQVGEDVWWTSYMHRPRLGANATFKADELARCKLPEVAVGPWSAMTSTILGVDPNLGAGFTSVTVLGCTPVRARVLDNEEHLAFSRTEDILDLIERFAATYRPQDVRIEQNNFQRGLVNDERLRKMSEAYGFEVHGHHTGALKNSLKLEDLAVSTMARSIIKRELEFPWHDDGGCTIPGCDGCRQNLPAGTTRTKIEPLIAEMEAWRPGVRGSHLKQDRLMSLWFAWILWMQRRGFPGINENAWKGRGWAGTAYVPLTGRRAS